MPLPAAAPRRHLHDRRISLQGYLRDDGLWDIEGHLTDTKAMPHRDHHGRELVPGEFIHDMWLRVTVDDERVIRAIAVAMDSTPFPTCLDVQASLDGLVGAKIGNGWRNVIRTKVARLSTCTHIAELLVPLASAVFQTLSLGKGRASYAEARARVAPDAKPFFIDGCHSWRSDGPNVAALYPQFALHRADPG